MFKPSPPPPGAVDVNEHERSLNEIAVAAEKRGLELVSSENRVEVATANQLLLAAIKARTAAATLATARVERDREEWLVGEYKRMNHLGVAPGNGRRLKRRTP